MIAQYEAPDKPAELFSPRLYGTGLRHKHLTEMQKVAGLEQPPVFCPVVDDYYKGMATTIQLHNRYLRGQPTAREICHILAAYYAKRMGLPVGKLICASNCNDVLTDFLRTGVYDKNRPFHTTMSPSMDILVSSNLERLLFDLSGENDAEVKGYMDALAKTGKYEVSDAIKAALADQFWGGFCGEAGTSAAIAKYYKENGYLIDTHTAVAANVMEQYRKATGDKTVTVFVSTASPYKFCDHVLRAIGETPAGDGVELLDQLHETTGTAIPRRLAALKGKARRFDLTCEKPGMDSVVLEFLK